MKRQVFLFIILSAALLFASFEAVQINPASVRNANISGFKKGDVLIPCMDFSKTVVTGNYLIPYGLSELSMQEAAVFFKVSGIGIMLAGKNFGGSDYRENSFTAAAEIWKFEGISIVPGISYYGLRDVLGSKTSFGADITALYSFGEKLSSAVSVKNIYAYETDSMDIPMTMLFHFMFKAPGGFYVFAGAEKDDKYDAILKTALEYQPISFFSVSAGYNFDPELLTAGFSLEYRGLIFSYGFSYHFDLEDSHSAGIVYEF